MKHSVAKYVTLELIAAGEKVATYSTVTPPSVFSANTWLLLCWSVMGECSLTEVPTETGAGHQRLANTGGDYTSTRDWRPETSDKGSTDSTHSLRD